jgi:PTS system galactitol-specific IIB component
MFPLARKKERSRKMADKKNKKFVFVCCGAGKLTSYMAAEGIRDGLKKRGIKNVNIQHGMISEVPRYEAQIDVLVCSTNYTSKHSFKVLSGLPFVVQDKEGEEKVINELVQVLESLSK